MEQHELSRESNTTEMKATTKKEARPNLYLEDLITMMPQIEFNVDEIGVMTKQQTEKVLSAK